MDNQYQFKDFAEKFNLLIRLVNAIEVSDFSGITCLDIDGYGNWFDVRDKILQTVKGAKK